MKRAALLLLASLLPGCQTLSDSMQAARINRSLQQTDTYFQSAK